MSINEIIEEIKTERKREGKRLSKKDIADYLGISRQNLVNKLRRDTFTPRELSMIAEYLGFELMFKGTEKDYIIRY